MNLVQIELFTWDMVFFFQIANFPYYLHFLKTTKHKKNIFIFFFVVVENNIVIVLYCINFILFKHHK